MATTARQNGKHPGGRPRTKTPAKWSKGQLKRIDAMAQAQCKDTTIAQVLGVDIETFRDEFSVRTAQKRDQGKARVLEAQFKGCFAKGKGAVTERVWWGKQHLEQSDKAEVKGELGFTLEIGRKV